MRYFITLFLIALTLTASARRISIDEAQAIACEILNASASPSMHSAAGVKGIRTSSDSSAFQPYYFFLAENDNGFVIVSGDDRLPKILGRSATGSFDSENLPPQLLELLECFAEQVNNLSTTSTHPSWSETARFATSESVVLETAEWGQGAPYNESTPLFGDTHAPTGCVATAMAIVMRYHNWPRQIDWESMPLRIDAGESNHALASLMRELGEAVNTVYSADESLGFTALINQSLFADYDYDGEIQMLGEIGIGRQEISELIKTEIDASRPVICSGMGTGSHAFVVDGYDRDGMYHINWGWDGLYNGFFALDHLCPEPSTDFSSGLTLTCGIHPVTSESIEYSKVAFVDRGYLHGIECFHGFGINPEFANLQKGLETLVAFGTLNVKAGCEWGIGISDKNGMLKEIISRENVNSSEPWSSLIGTNLVTPGEDINDGDRIGIYAAEVPGSGLWKPVRGTLETPSFVDAKGYSPKLSHIDWALDEGLEVELNYSNHIEKSLKSDFPLGTLISSLSIFTYDFQPLVEMTINGQNTGSFLGGWAPDKNGMVSTINMIEDHYSIKGSIIPSGNLKNRELHLESPGTLPDLLADEDLRLITSLRLTGTMDARDFTFIRNHLRNLRELDLSETSIDAWGQDVADYIPEDGLLNMNLREVFLPGNLVGIESRAFQNCSNLLSIEIPPSVKYYGEGCFSYCPYLYRIIVNNPVPVELPLEEYGWNGNVPRIIAVPEGCGESYRNADGWKKFDKIVEGRKPCTSISLVDGTGLSIETAYLLSTQVGVVLEPADTYDYVKATSSDQSIFTCHANYFEYGFSLGIAGRSIQSEQAELVIETSNGKKLGPLPVRVIRGVESLDVSISSVNISPEEPAEVNVESIPATNLFSLSYYCENNDIAYESEGKIYGVKSSGETKFIAGCEDGLAILSCGIPIYVSEQPDAKTEIIVGDSFSCSAEIRDKIYGNILPLEWSSSNPMVAEVDQSGIVTALAAGEVVLTASADNGYKINISLAIHNPALSGLGMIESEQFGLSSHDGGLYVYGLPADAVINIFCVDGRRVYHGTERTITGLTPGMYIVSCGGIVQKVIL